LPDFRIKNTRQHCGQHGGKGGLGLPSHIFEPAVLYSLLFQKILNKKPNKKFLIPNKCTRIWKYYFCTWNIVE